MTSLRLQRTIRRSVAVLGFGYYTGKDVRVEFRPAAEGSGISFVRVDLGSSARVPARSEYRIEVPRRTCLQSGEVRVEMVEHILATLAGLGIDNCEIHVDQPEMPGCDGSAIAFVAAIESVGTVEQRAEVAPLRISDHVIVEQGGCRIEAFPAESYSVEYAVNYPDDPVIGYQVADVEVTPDRFRDEIAPCRTFVLQREADEMLRLGLGRRVSPRDLLIFDANGPVSNQLRFGNECARHKALDVIGDMALTGREIVGRIVAYRSGHRLNAAFANELTRRFSGAALKASA